MSYSLSDYCIYTDIRRYEKEASEPKKNWEELASPVDLFEVTFVDLTKESAVPLHQYRAPILDKIQNAYTLKAQSKLNQAQDYGTEIYKPEIHNEGGNITATIKLNAPLVSMASDQYEEDSPLPTHKLTFQKLGVDFTLPFLFSQIKFKIPYIEEPSGVIYELDTEKEEFNGSPHRLIGEILDDEESNSVTKNLIQSSIPSAAAIGDRLSSATVSHSPPAPVFQNKEYRKAGEVLTVTTLSELNIDNKLLTDTAQDLIYKAMVYHMDAGDRKVLNADIPSVGSETDIGTLPYALANELTGDMRDWLKNTYARAVVALSFSNLSAITLKDWIVKYSDKQVKQIRYWWSGKGPRCLANDKHYRLLNQIATTYAARRICKGLRPFLDDTVPDEQKRVGGDKWASALFEKYSVEGKKTKREKRLAEYAFGNLVKDMNKDYYVKLMNSEYSFWFTLISIHQVLTKDPSPPSSRANWLFVQWHETVCRPSLRHGRSSRLLQGLKCRYKSHDSRLLEKTLRLGGRCTYKNDHRPPHQCPRIRTPPAAI